MKSETALSSDQPVILEQPAIWSRVFIWLIVGITASALIWASVAKIEQAVPAQGKLEPKGNLKDVKVPIGGVVRKIHVEGGDRVKKGDLLITLDSTASRADVESLEQFKEALDTENDAYRTQVGEYSLEEVANNEFALNQRQLLDARMSEARSQERAARLQVQELGVQRQQVRGQLQATRDRLASARDRLSMAQSRLAMAREQLETSRARLAKAREREEKAQELQETDRALQDRLEPLAAEGAISELQVIRQRQQVLSREEAVITRQNEIAQTQAQVLASQDEIAARQSEIAAIRDDIAAQQAEINRLTDEEQRLTVAIDRAREQLQNTVAANERQLRQSIAENQKQMTRLDSQLTRAKQQLDYQEIRAPVDGVVFDLEPNAEGFVVRDTEPVMKIVPNTKLVASVYVTNKDIGFVREGMEVELQFDAFPATEFGTIPGELVSIGEDVLEPTQTRQFYAFPVTIELDRQAFEIGDKEIPLQSGMAVNANISIRKRTVMSIFTDRFLNKTRGLETVR